MTTDEFVRLHGDESGVELVDGQIRRVPTEDCEYRAMTPVVISTTLLVVEQRATNDSIIDVCRRASAHLRAGVRVVLVLDPVSRMVGVFRSNEFPQRFHNGDTVILPDVLPGFAVPVGSFFE